MRLFGRIFGKKDDHSLIDGVALYDCVIGLLQDAPDDLYLRQAQQFKSNFERLFTEPGSHISVFFTLMHYYRIGQGRDMDVVANNVKCLAADLIQEAERQDPYEAKVLAEKLFQKWPEALRVAFASAEREDTEENLVFLAAAGLFGWGEGADAEICIGKLGTLEKLEKPEVYEWLKAQIKE